MKVFIVVAALATVALGEVISPVKVVDFPSVQDVIAVAEAELPSVLGYLVDVSIPLYEARKKAEQEFLAGQSRITGGTPAALGQVPWQAGLVTDIIGIDNGNGICGASLVSSNRLITAAHCWFDGVNTAWRVTVVLGSVFLSGSDGIRVQTTHIALHPQWTPELIRNDVAVLYLPNPVTFSAAVSPVSLPAGPELFEDFAGSTAIASGFGMTGDGDEHGITSDQFLSHVTVPVIDNAVCRRSFFFLVHDTNVCIDGSARRSTCKGDSGGPLVVFRRDRPVLIGVTSFGSPFGCSRGSPAAFARVTSFIDFFNQHV